MNKKELVQTCFKGKAIPRPPFLPMIGSYIAKVNQLPLKDILSNSNQLANGVIETRELLDYDAFLLPVDPTLEAEALGAELEWKSNELPVIKGHFPLSKDVSIENLVEKGRILEFVEAARRLVTVNGAEYPIIATVTGPLTILKTIYSENIYQDQSVEDKLEKVVQGSIQLCKSYGDVSVDGIVIYEDNQIPLDQFLTFASFYKPIFNVIKYYNMFGVWKLPPDLNNCSDLETLTESVISKKDNLLQLSRRKIKGIALDSTFWNESTLSEELTQIWRENKNRRVFFSTSVPLNLDIGLPQLQEKIANLCKEEAWI